jgi:hypothetical protein
MKLSASLNADPKGQSMELWNLKSLGSVLSTFASVWGAETYGRQVATCEKESPPPMSKSYMWSKLYASAVLETDLRKIPQRIREAEWAIRERFCSTMPIDLAERQIITGAKVRLKELKGRGLPKAIAHIRGAVLQKISGKRQARYSRLVRVGRTIAVLGAYTFVANRRKRGFGRLK